VKPIDIGPEDPWRMNEWRALSEDECGIGGCSNAETDQRGPVIMRDGSMHKVCPEHWEPIMRILGEQATWEQTDAMRVTAIEETH
jgi:hypothetical protein